MPDSDVANAKRLLRADFRRVRAELSASDDLAERSARIVRHLVELDAVRSARHVLSYRPVLGEVGTESLHRWCDDHELELAVPDASPDAVVPAPPEWPDVIVVPGLAFTASGARLGQGGGWYDRLLARRRANCVAIGLAFLPQLVDELPVEAHDANLDCVVTEDGPLWAP